MHMRSGVLRFGDKPQSDRIGARMPSSASSGQRVRADEGIRAPIQSRREIIDAGIDDSAFDTRSYGRQPNNKPDESTPQAMLALESG
jgi:hypothetical protein